MGGVGGVGGREEVRCVTERAGGVGGGAAGEEICEGGREGSGGTPGAGGALEGLERGPAGGCTGREVELFGGGLDERSPNRDRRLRMILDGTISEADLQDAWSCAPPHLRPADLDALKAAAGL